MDTFNYHKLKVYKGTECLKILYADTTTKKVTAAYWEFEQKLTKRLLTILFLITNKISITDCKGLSKIITIEKKEMRAFKTMGTT